MLLRTKKLNATGASPHREQPAAYRRVSWLRFFILPGLLGICQWPFGRIPLYSRAGCCRITLHSLLDPIIWIPVSSFVYSW